MTTRTLLGILAALIVTAPTVAAVSFGVDADKGIEDLKAVGAAPKYGQVWAGFWNKQYGWSSFESNVAKARDAGATPVVLWYYWGDSISVDAVKYGKDGRTKSDWDAMAKEVATRVGKVMGSRTAIVVLEPEFNKAGISEWETFDGYLENQAKILRAANPNLKLVVGFGHWSHPSIFDRAVAASDYTGFQYMRASTRDTAYAAETTGDRIVEIAKSHRAKWGKPVFMYDLAIGSYGGWEGVQENALRNVIARRGDMAAAGVEAVVWRYTRDNDYSSGYFGAAESSWGVKRKDLSNKPAWDELVSLVKGTTSTTASGSTSTSTSPVFSNVGGNEWWIQADVAGSPAKVEARVNGGAWVPLEKKSWGAWAVSTHAPTGSTVDLKATFSSSTATASFRWPDATPVTSSTSGTVFSGVGGNEWWIQANVAGSPSKVEARVNGGTWKAMELKSWGAWAVSTHAPTGSTVELKATFSSSTATAAYRWPDATPVAGTTAFDATFSNVGGNEWWVQASVKADRAIAGVDARVNGGTWKPLELKSWGAWAASIHAPTGSKVEFRARATDGSIDTSSAYAWPPA